MASKFIRARESFSQKRKAQLPQDWFGNRHGCHLIVLGHQHEELHWCSVRVFFTQARNSNHQQKLFQSTSQLTGGWHDAVK